MLFYQAHLALRDSDKATFENRVREGLHFIESNHPGYRIYMIEKLGIDRKNCTKEQMPNLKDMAPMFVLAHGQWAVFSGTLLLLNSRSGCILTAVHSVILAVLFNMYNIRPLILRWIVFWWKDGTPKYKQPSPCLPRKEFLEADLNIDKSNAFAANFMKSQKDWRCGLGYALAEMGLCILLWIMITK